MLSRIKKRHFVLLGLLVVLLGVGVFLWQNDDQKNGAFLRDYDAARDFQPLLKLMNDNKFWVAERPADFSPEKVLTLRAPGNDPQKKGTVNIDVIETENQTAGFIAYYKKSTEQGFIWLLAVDSNFRGRGFGERLVSNALANLKKKGARYAILVTRLVNEPALKLYRKLGFVEKDRDEDRGIITLIKREL